MGLFTTAAQKTHQEALPTQPAQPRSFVSQPAAGLMLAAELENAIDNLWVQLRGPQVPNDNMRHQAFLTAHWEPGVGASTLVTALAYRAAQLDPTASFCLVDFDVYNPGVTQLTDLERQPGVSDVMCENYCLDDVLAPTQHENLFVIPEGSPNRDWSMAQLFSRCRDLAEQLLNRFNVVFFDVPSLRSYPNFAIWANGLAQAILVVRAGQARDQAVAKALQTLRLMNVDLAAVALNGREYYLPGWLYSRT